LPDIATMTVRYVRTTHSAVSVTATEVRCIQSRSATQRMGITRLVLAIMDDSLLDE
jgi:hypothetical protein